MRTLAVGFAIAIAGCAGRHPDPGTIQPQEVRFTNSRDAVRGCTMLGVIDSEDKSNGGTVTQTPDERYASRRLQIEAARLQANLVLIGETPTGMEGNNTRRGRVIQGEAYRCERRTGRNS